jgi:hypothetical protein
VDGFVDDTNEVVVGPLGVKFAVTDLGALMVTVVEALLAFGHAAGPTGEGEASVCRQVH